MRDEDRQVAHDRDAARVRVGLDGGPLLIELPLDEAPERDLGGVLAPRCGERLRVACAQRLRPLPPRLTAVCRFERHEHRVVVEPLGLRSTPGRERDAVIGAGVGQETCARLTQLREPPRHDTLIGHARGVEAAGGQHRRAQPAARDERLECHHQRAAGERRDALVGRVAGADRRGRQQLPQALAGRDQPVDEVKRLGAEIADAVRAGQRGDVQQHTGAA